MPFQSEVVAEANSIDRWRQRAKKMAMGESILILFLLFIILLFLFLCKPWRFFFVSPSRSSIETGELERPLVPEEVSVSHNQSTELSQDYDLETACYPNESNFHSPQTHGLVDKQRLPAAPFPSNMSQGDSLVSDVMSDLSEDVAVGQTLKLSPAHLARIQKQSREKFENDRLPDFVPNEILDQRSCLRLEVIDGPSRGLHCSVQSTNPSPLPLTLGRVPPSDLLIKDSEVSGKHAQIKWNLDKMKWELVDAGSLNGTLLNSLPINHADIGNRHWGDPVVLTNGDIITLGTTSRVIVHISRQNQQHIPFGVGMASDPMALYRGRKKLAMEDVCYYHWPLPGLDQFGLFGICDGHGGDAAAKSASKLFPEIIANILSNSLIRERVLSLRDASDIFRDAFSQTEASMNHDYEGCTATVLLVWANDAKFFAQCANVGDSTCIISVDDEQIKMTEDHRLTSYSERLRMAETGEPLKDAQTRLYGINLARMLGDKFLKQQDLRFSSEPFISQVVDIDQTSRAFAILASDGLWDVMSVRKAFQLVLQMRERYSSDRENSAEKIANCLLNEAKTLRTKDNTSVIFLEFDSLAKFSGKVDS